MRFKFYCQSNKYIGYFNLLSVTVFEIFRLKAKDSNSAKDFLDKLQKTLIHMWLKYQNTNVQLRSTDALSKFSKTVYMTYAHNLLSFCWNRIASRLFNLTSFYNLYVDYYNIKLIKIYYFA